MRRVLPIFGLWLLTAVPTSTAWDCATDVGRQQACVALYATQRPSMPPGVPEPPAGTIWGTYYVFLAYGKCAASPLSVDCRGVPATGGNGVPTHIGYTQIPHGGTFGLIFQESNGIGGLQRSTIWPYTADRMVLV